MSDAFKIYLDRLSGGQVEKIEETFDPIFLDVEEEKDLKFEIPIEVSGEAYITDEYLIIHLKVKTSAKMPCSICNEMISVPVFLKNFYHTQPVNELKSAIFDYSPALREAVLLELPKYVECKGGNCPERKNIAQYLKKDDEPLKDDNTYFPFADIDRGENENGST